MAMMILPVKPSCRRVSAQVRAAGPGREGRKRPGPALTWTLALPLPPSQAHLLPATEPSGGPAGTLWPWASLCDHFQDPVREGRRGRKAGQGGEMPCSPLCQAGRPPTFILAETYTCPSSTVACKQQGAILRGPQELCQTGRGVLSRSWQSGSGSSLAPSPLQAVAP